MFRSAVTVSLVEEARGGPFVFWDGLETAFLTAAQLGFEAVEIFAPGPDFVSTAEVLQLCQKHNLKVAAVGTGAGMLKHGLSLTDSDEAKRRQAIDFVSRMIQFGAQLHAPAIIGSMQGRWNAQVTRNQALDHLSAALNELGEVADMNSVELFYEPLNRYETNLIRTMSEGCQFLQNLGRPNVKLLADLFHMNIEEASIEQALINAGRHVGHVHFVDSNRQAAGLGHMDYPPIIQALKQIDYQGYLSAEALPLPDSYMAAKKTIEAFHRLVG